MALLLPLLADIVMAPDFPSLAVTGVPDSAPVTVLKAAQLGLPVIAYVIEPVPCLIEGLKMYAAPAVAVVDGLPDNSTAAAEAVPVPLLVLAELVLLVVGAVDEVVAEVAVLGLVALVLLDDVAAAEVADELCSATLPPQAESAHAEPISTATTLICKTRFFIQGAIEIGARHSSNMSPIRDCSGRYIW